MRSRDLITGFHADVDLAPPGRPVQAMIFAQIRPLTRALIGTFHDEASAVPEVVAVFVLAGGDDFLLHVSVGEVTHLHSFLADKLSSRKEAGSSRRVGSRCGHHPRQGRSPQRRPVIGSLSEW